MDWGSLAGLLLGVGGILVGQVLEGGHIRSLLQPAAFIIVMVGTVGAVLLQSGRENFVRGLKLAGPFCTAAGRDCAGAQYRTVECHGKARRLSQPGTLHDRRKRSLCTARLAPDHRRR